MSPTIHNENQIVHGLWAAGEAASSSVHGANRLGANSLLDIVVFGKACADNIATMNKPGERIEACDMHTLENDIGTYEHIVHKTGTMTVADMRLEMQEIMQKHAGSF